MRVFFTAPVAWRIHLKQPTLTGFFTSAAGRWRLIIGYARVSTTEQNLGLGYDDLKPAFDASVDATDARRRTSASLDSHRGETPYHFGSLSHGFPQDFAFLQD